MLVSWFLGDNSCPKCSGLLRTNPANQLPKIRERLFQKDFTGVHKAPQWEHRHCGPCSTHQSIRSWHRQHTTGYTALEGSAPCSDLAFGAFNWPLASRFSRSGYILSSQSVINSRKISDDERPSFLTAFSKASLIWRLMRIWTSPSGMLKINHIWSNLSSTCIIQSPVGRWVGSVMYSLQPWNRYVSASSYTAFGVAKYADSHHRSIVFS